MGLGRQDGGGGGGGGIDIDFPSVNGLMKQTDSRCHHNNAYWCSFHARKS